MSSLKTRSSSGETILLGGFVVAIIIGYSMAGPIKEPTWTPAPAPAPTNCQQPFTTQSGMTINGALEAFRGDRNLELVPSELRDAANAFADANHISTDQAIPATTLQICLSPDNQQITSISAIQ